MKATQLTQINEFLSTTIAPNEFACYVRQLQDYAIRMALDSTDGDHVYVSEGNYWLNEFLEILDPKLQLSQ